MIKSDKQSISTPVSILTLTMLLGVTANCHPSGSTARGPMFESGTMIEAAAAFRQKLSGMTWPPPELPLFRIELKLVEFVDEPGVNGHVVLSDKL